MNPIRKNSINEVIEKSNYTPLINNLLITNPLHIEAILKDCRAVISTSQIVEEVEAAKSRINTCYLITDTLLDMTVKLLTSTDNSENDAVQTTVNNSVSKKKETKVIALNPKVDNNVKYNVVDIPEQFKIDLSEQVRFCKNLTDLESILRDCIKDQPIDLLYSYYIDYIKNMDISKLTIGENITPDEIKATGNLRNSSARLQKNLDAQISRFHNQVEIWHTRQPKTSPFKKKIERFTLTQVLETTKALHAEGKTEEAWAYAEKQLRKTGVVSDKDSTIVPHLAKESFEQWFKVIAPEYTHVEKIKIITPITNPATVEPSPFKAARTYEEVLTDVDLLISNGKLDDAKQLANLHLVCNGFINKVEDEEIIKWSDVSFDMFWGMYLESKTSPINENNEETIKAAETVLVEELLKNKEGDNVPQLGLFHTLLNKLNYSFDTATKTSLFKRVKAIVNDITTPAAISEDTNATIFVRKPLLESNPKEWDAIKSITKLSDLLVYCQKTNSNKLGFNISLNAAYDIITSGNIADAKDWTDEQIDTWFNTSVLNKNKLDHEETKVNVETPKKENVSTELESTTSQTPSESKTDGEKNNVETPIIKDRKKLLNHCANMIVMSDDERDIVDIVMAHAAIHKLNDGWADTYMDVIRKEAKKRQNKTK